MKVSLTESSGKQTEISPTQQLTRASTTVITPTKVRSPSNAGLLGLDVSQKGSSGFFDHSPKGTPRHSYSLSQSPIPEEERKKNPASIKEGFLRKCGGRVRTWHERYCVLSTDQLEYYKKKSDKKPAGAIKLDINTAVSMEDNGQSKGFVFQIRPSEYDVAKDAGRTFIIAANTEEERREWMLAIEAQIKTTRSPWEAVAKCASYAEPSPDAEYIGDLENGDVVQVLEVSDGWVRHTKGWSLIVEESKVKLKEMVVVRKGFLWKEGGKLSKTWHHYFFILYTHKLQYYQNIKDKDYKVIAISKDSKVEPRSGGAKPNAFSIKDTGGKLFVLAASSKEERNAWIASLRKAVSENVT
eukprot:TRINITY_DN4997_c0_g2_i1.p1 TRINITY_DN4997_c0_g2~~TRINITY_DN4997_c0_g2_i1.p1  ORF type:complete len:390 (+),score=79.58 TRINITY_DN4997_c0_g2_i1:108-1172(+)